ncbi:MAG: VWA domain-containing protein [Bacteroidota bacterium]
MLRFQHTEALYLLLGLIPLIAIFFGFMMGRKKAISRMGEASLVQRLMPGRPEWKHHWKFAIIALAYTSLVIALANPQLGRSYEKVKRSGIDLMVALDVSNSMLSDDETPNRLERAKLFIKRLIDELPGDRIGIVSFAGNAVLQVPITSDYAAAQTLLKTISPKLIPRQGTAIGEAIRIADKGLGTGDNKFKAILVISDGENHEGDALKAVEEVKEKGIVVHTMGVGTTKGSPIPVYNRNGDKDFKRNREGSVIFTKLNEGMLKEVANKGEGKYFRLQQGLREVDELVSEFNTMEKQEFEERVFADYEDQFQWFLGFAIFLLTLEYFISERRNLRFTDWSIFKT